MLNDARCLWRNREKPTSPCRWVKVWVKRCYHIVNLYRLLIRSTLFRWRGASVGRLVVLGRARIEGKAALLSIGEESSLGRCEIALHDWVTIGQRVMINDGVVLLTASYSLKGPNWAQKKLLIAISDSAWVATSAIVLPDDVTIDRGAVVGAGAVVRRDVPDYALSPGNPIITRSIQRNMELRYSPGYLYRVISLKWFMI